MFRLTNCIFSILNLLMLIFGIAVILLSVYLTVDGGSSECQKVIQTPLLILGAFLLVLSLLGLIGSACRITFVLWIYSFVTFVLVVGIICFMFFVFAVTNKGASKALSGFGYREYKLGDYSNWMQNHFVYGENWEKTKSCLIDAQVCKSFGDEASNQKAADFYKMKLSSIQSGCCKPPSYCGMEFKNATFWIMPKAGAASTDSDCGTWSNIQEKLCYECNSCKGGVLENISKDWRSLGILNACVLAFIIIIYSTSCCTRRNLKYRPYKNSSFYSGYHA